MVGRWDLYDTSLARVCASWGLLHMIKPLHYNANNIIRSTGINNSSTVELFSCIAHLNNVYCCRRVIGFPQLLRSSRQSVPASVPPLWYGCRYSSIHQYRWTVTMGCERKGIPVFWLHLWFWLLPVCITMYCYDLYAVIVYLVGLRLSLVLFALGHIHAADCTSNMNTKLPTLHQYPRHQLWLRVGLLHKLHKGMPWPEGYLLWIPVLSTWVAK